MGTVDLAHPARSNAVPDSIVAEPTADHDRSPRRNWLASTRQEKSPGPPGRTSSTNAPERTWRAGQVGAGISLGRSVMDGQRYYDRGL